MNKVAHNEIVRLKNEEGLIIQLIDVKDIMPITIKSTLKNEFKALDYKIEKLLNFLSNRCKN